MQRFNRTACVATIGLTVVCLLTSCSKSSARFAGNVLTLTNDTASAVTVEDCRHDACIGASPKPLAAGAAATFPLSDGPIGSQPDVLTIVGYGDTERCLDVPSKILPDPPHASVTDVLPGLCAQPVAIPDIPPSAPVPLSS